MFIRFFLGLFSFLEYKQLTVNKEFYLSFSLASLCFFFLFNISQTSTSSAISLQALFSPDTHFLSAYTPGFPVTHFLSAQNSFHFLQPRFHCSSHFTKLSRQRACALSLSTLFYGAPNLSYSISQNILINFLSTIASKSRVRP